MPPLIRRYIKTSFAFLIAGVLLGSYVSVAQFLLGTYPARLVITAHGTKGCHSASPMEPPRCHPPRGVSRS